MHSMQNVLRAFSLALISLVGLGRIVGAQNPSPASPAWAYGFPPLADDQPAVSGTPAPAATPARPPDTSLKRIPGSSKEFTLAHIRDYWDVGDWFPEDHPPMPSVVVHGRQPHVRGCAMCHMPNGKGRPENAPIAGQSYAYILQQLTDFKNGLRASADPRKLNTTQMIEAAKDMTDDEMKAASEYFSSMKWTPWIRVVEAADVPKTRLSGNVFMPLAEGGTEPIGNRIVESPEECRALRASRSALGLHRLRSTRQPSEGGGARGERRWQDDAMRRLSRHRLERPGPGPCHRREIAELSRAPAVRHAAGHPQGRVVSADEACRGESDARRHAGYRCVRGVTLTRVGSARAQLRANREVGAGLLVAAAVVVKPYLLRARRVA